MRHWYCPLEAPCRPRLETKFTTLPPFIAPHRIIFADNFCNGSSDQAHQIVSYRAKSSTYSVFADCRWHCTVRCVLYPLSRNAWMSSATRPILFRLSPAGAPMIVSPDLLISAREHLRWLRCFGHPSVSSFWVILCDWLIDQWHCTASWSSFARNVSSSAGF